MCLGKKIFNPLGDNVFTTQQFFGDFTYSIQPFWAKVPHLKYQTQKMIWVTIFSVLPRVVYKLVLFCMHRREVNSIHPIILSEAYSVPYTLLGVCNTKIRPCSQGTYIPKEGKIHLAKKYISNIIHKILLFSSNSSGKMFKVRVIIYEGIVSPLLSITDSGKRMSSMLIPCHSWRILVII